MLECFKLWIRNEIAQLNAQQPKSWRKRDHFQSQSMLFNTVLFVFVFFILKFFWSNGWCATCDPDAKRGEPNYCGPDMATVRFWNVLSASIASRFYISNFSGSVNLFNFVHKKLFNFIHFIFVNFLSRFSKFVQIVQFCPYCQILSTSLALFPIETFNLVTLKLSIFDYRVSVGYCCQSIQVKI